MNAELIRIPAAHDIDAGAAVSHVVDGGNRFRREGGRGDRYMRRHKNADVPGDGARRGAVGEGLERSAPHIGLATQAAPLGDRQNEFDASLVGYSIDGIDIIPFREPALGGRAQCHAAAAVRTEQAKLVFVGAEKTVHRDSCTELLW